MKLLDENPNAVEDICAQCDWISEDVVWQFERIGRRSLLPKLLLCDAPGVRALRRMAYSEQERYADTPMDVLVLNGGQSDTLKVLPKNMTAAQAAQVFDRESIRSLSAQRAWMMGRKEHSTFPTLDSLMPYKIKNGQVKFTEGCTLNAKQVAEILSNMS